MRILIALAVVLALAIAGVVGFVIHSESQRGHAAVASGASGAAVATISNGEEVDVDASVPQQGHTIVMFTADW